MSEIERHPTVDKLHAAFDESWKTLPPAQKEAIKEAVRVIADQDSQLFVTPQETPRFSESRFVMFTSERGQLMLPVAEGSTAGILWELTARGDTVEDILSQVVTAQRVAINYGFIPKDVYLDKRRQERGEGQPAPAQPAFTQAQPQTAGGHGGTSRLLKIVVASPGKAEFHCDGMQYAMKDSRGAKTLVSLFDPDLPFTEDDFATEAIYTPANKWGNANLMVDWEGVEKEGRKYRNILRVHI